MPHPTPLTPDFALEYAGLRLWSPLDRQQVRTLDDALATHGVLVFRRQSLTESELVAFSKRFGTPACYRPHRLGLRCQPRDHPDLQHAQR